MSPRVSIETGGDAVFIRPQIDASVHIGSQTNISGDLIIQVSEGRPALSPGEIKEKARHLLAGGRYDECASLLRQVLMNDCDDLEAQAYLIPCLFRGRNASFLSHRVEAEIEAFLRVLINEPRWRGFSLTAWAILKHDRYVLNGIPEGQPRLRDLLAQLKEVQLSPEEADLIAHIPSTSSARRLLGS